MYEIPDVKTGNDRVDAVVVDEEAIGSVQSPGCGAKILRGDGALESYISKTKSKDPVCYEGKPLFEFDRARMFRSGLVGFSFHGSLSHYYYHFCEVLFPFQDWWVVPAKVLFDQTVWSAIWNSIYFVLLGFLRLELPSNIFSELKATFWPMLTAGWKLWPFAHLITYGVIPVEQRLLWVDCVELVWVTILSTYSNEKSKAASSETPPDMNRRPPSIGSEE